MFTGTSLEVKLVRNWRVIRAISCFIFGHKYIVFMKSPLFKQLLNLNRMALKNFNLVFIPWHKSKNLIRSYSFLWLRASSCWVFTHFGYCWFGKYSANNRFHLNMLTWNNFEFCGSRKQIILKNLKLSPNFMDLWLF